VRCGGGVRGGQCTGHALVAADFDRQFEPLLAGGAAQRFGGKNRLDAAFASGDDYGGSLHGNSWNSSGSSLQEGSGVA